MTSFYFDSLLFVHLSCETWVHFFCLIRNYTRMYIRKKNFVYLQNNSKNICIIQKKVVTLHM